MLIILEGLDRTGKSTLAVALAEPLSGTVEIRHCDAPTRHPLEEYERDLDDYRPGQGRHVIYDRHLWGERVWPTIYGRESRYTDEMHLHAELYLRSRGALVVYCRADEGAIIERLRRANDPYPPADKVGEALMLFSQVRWRSALPWMEYDFTRAGAALQATAIIENAGILEEEAAAVGVSHWVGFPRAGTLLVGDRPGPKVPDDTAVPFRPYGGTVGSYLMRAVTGIARPALTNAWDGFGPVNLRRLYEDLYAPQVVALGAAADEALSAAEVPHGTVPHPQWARRFHYSKLVNYRDLIREAAVTQLDLRSEAHTWT